MRPVYPDRNDNTFSDLSLDSVAQEASRSKAHLSTRNIRLRKISLPSEMLCANAVGSNVIVGGVYRLTNEDLAYKRGVSGPELIIL